MDIVFCGTPQFAVPSLERLAASGFRVKLVVTQPDRPSGRGLELSFSPVKQTALRLGLRVAQPEKIKQNADFRSALETIAPQAIVVVGYGRLIPPWMLPMPPLGNINLHASLLPKYRGAAPIQWAIANGEIVSGNTTMRLDAGLDTGDILLQEELPILSNDTALTYGPRLAATGADLLVKTLHGLEQGTVTPRPQDHSQATLAPVLKKEDGRVDFSLTARQVHDRLRGFQPWPGVYTFFRGSQLKLIAVAPAAEALSAGPGRLLISDGRLYVGCSAHTTLEIRELQLEGKKRMTARDFINGYRIEAGETLG
jgi:methionyl-tRNA formyltransferase